MMSLHYDVDEEKDIDSQAGPLSVWSLHALPMSLWVFPPHSMDVHVRRIGVSKLCQSECEWKGGFVPRTPSCRDRLQPP